jgi:ribosomal protein S18 acetylase RimI-like enzyme
MSVAVRAARAGDAARLAEIFLRAWRDAYRGVVADEIIDGLQPAELERWWTSLVTEHDVVVAVRNDEPVGMARFGADLDDASRGHLFSLYVDPTASGAGVGQTLLAHVSAQLAAAGYTHATLWVFAANERALRFYRAAGWEPTGEERVEEEWGALEVQLAIELAKHA